MSGRVAAKVLPYRNNPYFYSPKFPKWAYSADAAAIYVVLYSCILYMNNKNTSILLLHFDTSYILLLLIVAKKFQVKRLSLLLHIKYFY